MRIKKSNIICMLQILGSIYKIKRGRRIPLYCEWEITRHCNMACDFCSTRIKSNTISEDTSREEALDIIEQLSDMGTKILHFSGGEPTLREDLPNLIEKAKSKGMIVSLTTNGSAPPQKMKNLLQADLIQVSIDGTEEFHDFGRKSPGAFKKAINTLLFLKSENCRPQITVIYTPLTSYQMLTELADISRKLGVKMALGVLGRNINENPIDSHQTDIIDLASPLFAKFIEATRKLQKDYRSTIADPEPFLTIIEQGGLDVFGCRAMDIAISIKHDGSISMPCNGLALERAKGNLAKLYYSNKALQLRALQGRDPLCKGCHIRCMCLVNGLLKVKGLIAIVNSYIRSLS